MKQVVLCLTEVGEAGERRKQHELLILYKTSEACSVCFLFRLSLGFSIRQPGDCNILRACKWLGAIFAHEYSLVNTLKIHALISLGPC